MQSCQDPSRKINVPRLSDLIDGFNVDRPPSYRRMGPRTSVVSALDLVSNAPQNQVDLCTKDRMTFLLASIPRNETKPHNFKNIQRGENSKSLLFRLWLGRDRCRRVASSSDRTRVLARISPGTDFETKKLCGR
jgi:hypothetical protein